MNKWEEAKRLVFNKMCGPARNGGDCGDSARMEAQAVLKELDAHEFTDLARKVLTNRLCWYARNGYDCGDQVCIEIKKTLDAFARLKTRTSRRIPESPRPSKTTRARRSGKPA